MKVLIAFIVGVVAVPVLFGVAAIAGFLPSDAASNPPGWETSIGMRAVDASLEKRAGGLRNPIASNDAAALAAGQKIYGDKCEICHGDASGASAWGSTGLYPRAPQFFQEGSDVSPVEAFGAIHDGIRYSGMGAWRGQLKDDEIWKLANFVASLRGKGGMAMDKD